MKQYIHSPIVWLLAALLLSLLAAFGPLLRPLPTPSLTPEEVSWVEQSRADAYQWSDGLWLHAPRLVLKSVEVRPYGRRIVFDGYGLFAWRPRWQVIIRLEETGSGEFHPTGGAVLPYGTKVREEFLK